VGWVVACSVVALLIDPLVSWLQRWLPRWASVVAVLLFVVAVVGGLVVGLITEILDSLDDLEAVVPEAASALEERFEWARELGVVDRADHLIDALHTSVREATVGEAIGTVPTYLVTGILMLFILGYGRRYVAGFLSLFDDAERRERWHRVIHRTAVRGRTYLLATLAHSAATGLVFGAFCWAVELPAPLGLGFAAALLTPIPLIGTFVGGVPALLLAFGLRPWWVSLLTLAVLVGLQLFEAIVVRRVVDRRTVRVGPMVPIVVGLLAYELYWVGGAVYAIALAVLALAAVDAVGWVQGDDPHPENLKESGIAIDDTEPDPVPG
jgi:predicted PurR-regulated permease PerM